MYKGIRDRLGKQRAIQVPQQQYTPQTRPTGLLSGLAAKGRMGDTRMAHVTPGEVIVPREVVQLRPDIMRHIGSQIRKMGGNPRRLTVGRGRINPRTGVEEFATEAEVRAAYESQLGRAPDEEGLAYWMGQGNNFETAFNTAAQQEVANRPSLSQLNQVYQEELGRPIDEEGVDYWTQDVIDNPGIDYRTAIINAAARNQSAPTSEPPPAPTQTPPPAPDNSWADFLDYQKEAAATAAANATTQRAADDARIAELLAGIKEATARDGLDYVDQGRSTVAGQLSTLLGSNSPYIAEARRSGMLEAAKRGGVNSTASASAAQRAAIQSAIPIASQDASTYAAAQGRQQESDIASGLSTQEFGQERALAGTKFGFESTLQDRQIAGQTAGELTIGAQTIAGNLATGAQKIAGDIALSKSEAADRLGEISLEGSILKDRDAQSIQGELDLKAMGIEGDNINTILGINGRIQEQGMIIVSDILTDINIENKGDTLDILGRFWGNPTLGAEIMTGLEA